MITSGSLTQKLHEIVIGQPCAQERHDPFTIAEETSERGSMIFGYVRQAHTSWMAAVGERMSPSAAACRRIDLPLLKTEFLRRQRH